MSELAKRLPDDLLERRDRMRNASESALRFNLAETHADESLKRLCSRVSDGGTDGAPVRGAIGVGEREPGSGSTRDDERAVVGSAVVGAAEGEEIGDEVFAAFAATLEIVDVQVYARARVASNAHVCVHVPDVLSVALRHLDDFGTDLDELPASLLRGPATALANRERDLVARAPRVPIPRKGLPTEQQKSCVVVERAPPRHAESSPSLRDKSPKPRLTARGAAGGARAASPESPRA